LYELDVGASQDFPVLRKAVICAAMFGMDIEVCGVDSGWWLLVMTTHTTKFFD
jgi:hypothetical protein